MAHPLFIWHNVIRAYLSVLFFLGANTLKKTATTNETTVAKIMLCKVVWLDISKSIVRQTE